MINEVKVTVESEIEHIGLVLKKRKTCSDNIFLTSSYWEG